MTAIRFSDGNFRYRTSKLSSDGWGRQSNVINMLNRVVSAVCAIGDLRSKNS